MGSRATMMATYVGAFREARSGAYYVKRGAIIWRDLSWPLAGKDRAVAIMIDEGSLLPDAKGFYHASITVEIAIQMSQPSDDPPQVDDDLMDEVLDDARDAVKKLVRSVDDRGDPVVFKLDNDVPFVEWHDAGLRLQGVVLYTKTTY